jgi:hypothetical protein
MSSPVPIYPGPYPPGIENLTATELAQLAANERCRKVVPAEVCRRLQNNPDKATLLTFRWLTYTWLVPVDEKEGEDAYSGLIGCCWNATKRRNPDGLFPRGYPETKQDDGYREGGIAEETRECIKSALAERLYDLRTLSAPEIVLTALNGRFRTDADVANGLRRRARGESKRLFQYGDDEIFQDNESEPLTLFEVVADDPGPRTNVYNAVLKVITQEKAQVVEELGEKGWTAWEGILELVDSLSAAQAETGASQNERDFDRSLTGVFERVYGVKERQAFTHKSRFLVTIKRIVEAVLAKRLGRGDMRKRSVAEYSPPVVPMEVIQQTSGMPVISRLHWLGQKWFGDDRDQFDGERSSVGRDVPPDEWQEIKARLKGKFDGE